MCDEKEMNIVDEGKSCVTTSKLTLELTAAWRHMLAVEMIPGHSLSRHE